MKTEPQPQTGDSHTKGLTQTPLLNCSKKGKKTFHSQFRHSKTHCRIDCGYGIVLAGCKPKYGLFLIYTNLALTKEGTNLEVTKVSALLFQITKGSFSPLGESLKVSPGQAPSHWGTCFMDILRQCQTVPLGFGERGACEQVIHLSSCVCVFSCV